MKNLEHWFRYIGGLGLACLGLLIMSGLAPAQMPVPSGNQALVVPYYCAVGSPVLNDNPLLSKPLGLGPIATGGSTMSPTLALDFTDWVDLYVAASAYSNPADLWVLGPDGQFRLFTSKEDIEPSLSASGVRTGLLGGDVSTAGLPIDTYYFYLLATPSGETLTDQTPYYMWTTSFAVLPPYLTMTPSCLQMESTVGVGTTQLVTISDPDDSTSYTISSVTAGGEGFTIENNNCGEMRGGSSCSFTISFNPTSEGVHNVDLSIGIDGYQNDAAGPQEAASAPPPSITIPLVGMATPGAASCEPTFSTANLTFNSLSQSGSIGVTYPTGCSTTWTASTDASWITITQKSGSGSGTATFTLSANTGTSASDRSGTITVAGKTFTVMQYAPATTGSCTYSISPPTGSIGSAGGTGAFQLTTQSGCEWLASGNLLSTWLSPSSRSGTGSSPISYSATANLSSNSRTGYITVEGKTFTLTQAGAQAGTACTYSLNSSNASVVAGGGDGSFTIRPSGSSCSPSVITFDSWLHVTSTTSGTSGITVNYHADANVGAIRTGTITVNGTLDFTVTQSGSGGTTPACTYTLSKSSQSFTAAAGTGSFSVTVTGTNCSWSASASPSNSWIHITSQTGSSPVTYSVDANSTTISRSGSITAGGQSFSITQAGSTSAACTYSLSSQAFTSDGGTGNITVVTGSNCTWTATSSDPSWLVVPTGQHTGSASFTVEANGTTNGRGAAITLAGQTFIVMQAGYSNAQMSPSIPAAPAVYIPPAPGSTSAGATPSSTGGYGSFSFGSVGYSDLTVAADAGSAGWITITSGGSISTPVGGSADGQHDVTYNVLANTSSTSRQGKINIINNANGTVINAFTITQDAAPAPISLSYTTLPGLNAWYTYSLSGRSDSTTPPEMGRKAMFIKFKMPDNGCPQMNQIQFLLGGLRANVNMLVADPDHPFTDLDSAFTTYNGLMPLYIGVGPPYWYQFSGSVTSESNYVTNANSYAGKTFYIMLVDEDTLGTNFTVSAACY